MLAIPSVTCSAISWWRGHCGKSAPRWKPPELPREKREAARGLSRTRYEGYTASVITFAIEFRLDADVSAFSQKSQAVSVKRTDGELVKTLVGIVGQRQHTR